MQALRLDSFAGSKDIKTLCLLGLFSESELAGRTKIHSGLLLDILVFLNKKESLVSHLNCVCRAWSVLGCGVTVTKLNSEF